MPIFLRRSWGCLLVTQKFKNKNEDKSYKKDLLTANGFTRTSENVCGFAQVLLIFL
jgi:hypothetical protein